MKTKTTIKFFAALLMMAVGGASSAWAGDVTTLYGRGTAAEAGYGITAWGDDDITAWGATDKFTVDDPNGLGASWSTKGSFDCSYTFTAPSTYALITYDIQWYSQLRSYAGYYNRLYFGDKIYFHHEGDGTFKMNVDGTEKSTTCSNATVIQISLTINTATKSITALSVTQNESTKFQLSDLTTAERIFSETPTYNTLRVYGYDAKNGTDYVINRLKRVLVQQETQDEPTSYSYTVNYKDGDDIVKTVDGSGYENALIPISESTTAWFYGTEEGFTSNQYVIIADTKPKQLITSSTNVVNIPVRQPYSNTLTVRYYLDGVLYSTPKDAEAITETDPKTSTYTYVFPYVISNGGHYYITEKVNGKFGESPLMDGTDVVKNIYYTRDDDIVYWNEGGGSTPGTTISQSNGNHDTFNKNKTISQTFAANTTYEISLYFTASRSVTIKNGEESLGIMSGNNSVGSLLFTFDSNVESIIIDRGSSTIYYDYILIRKSPSVTIGTTKFATYSYNHALDCSALPSGLKAYAVTVDGETLDFNEVTTAVSANTGLLLNGTASTTFTIPLAASGSAPASNALVSTNTTLDTSANDYYALGTATEGVAFRLASGDVVSSPKANKAYLQVAKGGGARQFIINWDSVTGVSQIENRALTTADTFFDLQGRKVTTLKKGIYILGGKKVMVK